LNAKLSFALLVLQVKK